MGDIYKLFDIKQRNAAGIYSIRLWNMGLPVSVVVDDYFAFKQDNTPAFSKFSPSKEIWPMLLEKAIAKAIANYDFAAVGTPNDAMFILTGAPGSFFTNSTKTAVQIFDQIISWFAAGNFVVASTTSMYSGIVAGHAYTVLGAYTLSNGEKVLKLRNPWAYGEWTAAYSDTDPYWAANPVDAEAVGFKSQAEGIFFMTAADYKARIYTTSY